MVSPQQRKAAVKAKLAQKQGTVTKKSNVKQNASIAMKKVGAAKKQPQKKFATRYRTQ